MIRTSAKGISDAVIKSLSKIIRRTCSDTNAQNTQLIASIQLMTEMV